MTNERVTQYTALHSRIFSAIRSRSVQGAYPKRHCLFCSGHDIGYYDSQSFQHEHGCPIPLIDDLEEMIREDEDD